MQKRVHIHGQHHDNYDRHDQDGGSLPRSGEPHQGSLRDLVAARPSRAQQHEQHDQDCDASDTVCCHERGADDQRPE